MRLLLLATSSALALAGGARADDGVELAMATATVDPVTVIGTRTEKPLSEAPATVSIIEAEQIEDQLANDVKDLFRYEPGVSVRSSPARFGAALGTTGRDGNAGFNIRGLEGDRVLVQVDGVRTPDSFVFGAQAVGRGDYGDLDLLKSAEVLRGPASALYGSDGVAGAISFTTKDPEDFLKGRDYAAQAKGAYASADESWAGGLVAAGRSGDWSGFVAYTRREGHEQETQGTNYSANTDRTAANPQDIQSNAVLVKVVYDLSDANRFRLTYEHLDRDIDSDVLSGISKPAGNPPVLSSTAVLRLLAADTIKRDRISFDHRYEGGGAVSKALWNLYWQDSETEQFTAEDRFTAADRTRRNTFDNRVYGGGVELHSEFGQGAITHRLVYGGDISRTRQEGVRDGTVPPVGESFPTRAFPNTDYTLAGAYIQDEIALFDGALTLYPALRYDWYDLDPKPDPTLPPFTAAQSSGDRLSPKFGALLKPTEKLGVFVNYAEGFKAPAPSQVNNAFANPIQNYLSVPNPDLKPETSKTVEAGVRWTDAHWSLGVTGFHGEYQDFIEQVQVSGSFTPTDPGVFQYVNLGKVKIGGVEARGALELDSGFGGVLAASYAKGEATADGKGPLDSVDPFKLVVGATYRDPGGRFGGQLIATHSAGKSAGRAACSATCLLPDDFTILDLTAYWNITTRATLRAGVFNITDEKYWWWSDVRGVGAASSVLDAYTQPGRNYAVSLTLRL